jgi:hypothetical protein
MISGLHAASMHSRQAQSSAWIGSLAVHAHSTSNQIHIYAGCYDGHVRVYDDSLGVVCASVDHNTPVRCIAATQSKETHITDIVTNTNTNVQTYARTAGQVEGTQVFSGGKDQTIVCSHFVDGTSTQLSVLRKHANSVESLCIGHNAKANNLPSRM